MTDNPYEAPEARLDDVPVSDAEGVRRAHLRREAGLRGVGVLCLVLAAYLLLMGSVFLATGVGAGGIGQGMAWGMGGTFLGLGAIGLAAAWGYLRLRPWVHIPAAIVSLTVLFMTAMLGLPLVALAAWITWSAKGRRVLSDDYAAIRAATPTLRAWREPREALWLLGLLGAYLVLAVLAYQQFAQFNRD